MNYALREVAEALEDDVTLPHPSPQWDITTQTDSNQVGIMHSVYSEIEDIFRHSLLYATT